MKKNILLLTFSLALLLISCGTEKLPAQLESMEQSTKETIEGMERSNTNIERLLEHCFNFVFKHDIISPFEKENPEFLEIPYQQFDIKLNKSNLSFYKINTSDLEVYFDIQTETAYYLVPDTIKMKISSDITLKFSRDNSLCKTVDTLIDNKIETITESILSNINDSEEILISKAAEILNKVEDARVNCKEVEMNKSIQDYKDSQIKWWQFKKKKEKKDRIEIERISEKINPSPCSKRASQELSDEEVEYMKEVVDIRWSNFANSWGSYYRNWKESKSLIFNEQQREKILTLELESTRVITLYELKSEQVERKLRILNIAKPVFPYHDSIKLRNFLASNEKSMRIDPDSKIDYNQTPLDRIDVLKQIFERYFYSANTKEEKYQIRLFITDATFMLLEQQIIEAKLDGLN